MENQIILKELSSHEAMMEAFPLIFQRYEKMTREDFSAQLSEMISRSDFKIIAAFFGEKIVGIGGYTINRMLYCGRYLQLSSFIVDEEKRGLGIGKKILAEAEKIAAKNACDKIVLDSFVENKKSHPLYLREGFHVSALHFVKDLRAEV